MKEPELSSKKPNKQESANVSPEKPLLLFKCTHPVPAEAYTGLQKSVDEVARQHGYGGILVDHNFDVEAVPTTTALVAAIQGQTDAINNQAEAMQAMAEAIADMVLVIANEGEDEAEPHYLDGSAMNPSAL